MTGVASFGLVLALIPDASQRAASYFGFIRVDALSVVFLLATSFLYARGRASTPSATCAAARP